MAAAQQANSLFTGNGLRAMLERAMPPGVTTFGQCGVPLHHGHRPALQPVSCPATSPPPRSSAPCRASATVPVVRAPIDYAQAQLVDWRRRRQRARQRRHRPRRQDAHVINAGYNEQILAPAHGVLEVRTPRR